MLAAIGADVARRAGRRGRARRASATPIPRRRRCRRAGTETEVLAELRALAARNTVTVPMIGLGYDGTITPPVIRAQRAGEPGLVHRLHAVPAGDQPGPAGGAAQLPDHGRRPHRPARGGRIAAGRGHRRGRGDDAAPPAPNARPAPGSSSTPTRCRRPSTCCHPRRAARHRARGRRPGRRAARRRVLRRAAVLPGRVGRRARPAPRSSTPRTSAARWSPSPPTCWRSPCSPRPASSGPTSRSAPPSASGCRSASADRTPATSRCATSSPASCPAGWSGCPTTPTAAPRCGWPCRPASSTSAARRPPRTSAPRRCCWPSSPPATPSTTARTGCARIARRAHRMAAVLAAGLRAGGVEVVHDAFFDTVRAGCRAGPRRSPTPRTHAGIALRRVDADTPGHRLLRAHDRRPPRGGVGGVRRARPTSPRSTRTRPTRCPPSSRAPASTSRTRSSTSTARRRR